MNFNDMLQGKGIDPQTVLVLRHRPSEPQFNKVLPLLAEERPLLFNAYQQTQGEKLEQVMRRMVDTGYIASFIGIEAGKALFVGLYSIGKSESLTYNEYLNVAAHIELKAMGMNVEADAKRSSILWFDLVLTDFYASWKGKLIVGWPPPERSWWRRAHRNDIPILAVLEDNSLGSVMPEWELIDLSWEELQVLPTRWKSTLAQWRGIYYIFDTSDGKGYVGSAYGAKNLLGRWMKYAARGDGGNRLLRQRDPRKFQFTILERVSPDMDDGDVIRLEASWKQRLHTRTPYGLNDN